MTPANVQADAWTQRASRAILRLYQLDPSAQKEVEQLLRGERTQTFNGAFLTEGQITSIQTIVDLLDQYAKEVNRVTGKNFTALSLAGVYLDYTSIAKS